MVLAWLGRLVDFLGGPGPVVFEILLLFVTPQLDRLLVRRKRISYRVLYNSRIGLSPESPHNGDDPAEAGTPERLREVVRLLDRLSMVVIRIRNSGSKTIGPDDFEEPLSFTFGKRIVWNARVSDASAEEVRQQLRNSLRFFPSEEVVASPPERDNLLTVRQKLNARFNRWFGGPVAGPVAVRELPEPRWHGVRMEGLSLGRRQKAKLVVVLQEPAESAGAEITKDVVPAGKLKDTGLIIDERRRSRLTLPRITWALAAVLTAVLVLSLIVEPAAPPAHDPSVACAPGELRVEGSTVFVPTMKAIADDYLSVCGSGTKITTTANGSIAGVRAVAESGPGGGIIALSDGTNTDHHDELYAEQIAIVVYHVVVHPAVGLSTLSLQDLRRIYDGTYTNWSQLPGGHPALPIRIVSRGQGSGTRQLFERNVLHTGEGELSSNECVDKDRNPSARIIRCERDTNSEIVDKISTIPGAIGYADGPSIAQARRTHNLVALTLDGKAFDTSTAVDSGYPFWTVEYLYAKRAPEPGSLAANFIDFARRHARARDKLTEVGFRPCATPQGPLELCTLR